MVYADFGNFRLASISRLVPGPIVSCETLPLSEGINLEARIGDSEQYLVIAKFTLDNCENLEIKADGERFSKYVKDLDRFNLIWNTAKNILLYDKFMKEAE